MSAPYHSFLICFHPGHTDVYRNGLPLGVLKDNVFTAHQSVAPDGRVTVTEIPSILSALVREVCDKMQEATP